MPLAATLAAGLLGAGLTAPAQAGAHDAAEPREGTVSLAERTVTWEGHHYVAGSSAFPGVTCAVPSDDVCDLFCAHRRRRCGALGHR